MIVFLVHKQWFSMYSGKYFSTNNSLNLVQGITNVCLSVSWEGERWNISDEIAFAGQSMYRHEFSYNLSEHRWGILEHYNSIKPSSCTTSWMAWCNRFAWCYLFGCYNSYEIFDLSQHGNCGVTLAIKVYCSSYEKCYTPQHMRVLS